MEMVSRRVRPRIGVLQEMNIIRKGITEEKVVKDQTNSVIPQ